MSIYATLWHLYFPRDGDWADDLDDLVELYAQAVPPHIDYTGPIWDWLPPPVPDTDDLEVVPTPRAVFIVGPNTSKGTARNGQEYVNPLLVLTGEEYERIRWVDLLKRIQQALWTDYVGALDAG